MSKKMLLATVAAMVAMMASAHADISHTRFFSCMPAFTWNEADPVVEVAVGMEITQRPNDITSQIKWSIVHRTQHGAAFFREQQYGDRRWVQPNFSRPLWQWTGHLLKDYAVFMTGELEDHGRGNITYKEYIANQSAPWEGTRVITRSACRETTEMIGSNDNFTPPPHQERRPEPRGTDVAVTEDLHLRQYPSANSADLLNGSTIPEGTTFTFQDLTACQKARNGYMWCPVFWPMNGFKIRGWVSAYFLRTKSGERLACFLQPGSEQCADVDVQVSNHEEEAQATQPYEPVSPPTMRDAPSWLKTPRRTPSH
jgi:hypothetical protein